MAMKTAGQNPHVARAQEPWMDPDVETYHDEMSGRVVTWSVDHEYRLNTPVGKRKEPGNRGQPWDAPPLRRSLRLSQTTAKPNDSKPHRRSARLMKKNNTEGK